MNIGNTFRKGRGLKARSTKVKPSKVQHTAILPTYTDAGLGSVASSADSDADNRIEARRSKLEGDGVLLGNSLDGKSFDDVNAEIKRRDWNEFAANDRPYILNYADEITSGKHLDRAISQARTGVEQGFNQAQETQTMRDKGMGVGLSDAQQSDRVSDVGRSKTAALIDAENNARLAGTDRENALLAGSHMPNTGN
jgi:hypothetical protein